MAEKQQQRNNHRTPSQKKQGAEDVKVGQKFPLTIKRLGINGEGIGYFKKKIVFIPGALPGEVVTAKVTEITPKYLTAKVVTIREKSEDRIQPKEEKADQVGGFELAHLNYEAQLAFKDDLIRQALEKFTPKGYRKYDIRPTLGMVRPFHYRNKATFPIRQAGSAVAMGLYERGSHQLVNLKKIATQDQVSMAIANRVRDVLVDQGVSLYHEKKKFGLIKTIIVRANQAGQGQLTLVTNQADFPAVDQVVAALRAKIPALIGIFQNINPGESSAVWGNETKKLWGADYLDEEIMGLTFSFSPRAFLQLNYEQMLATYETAIAALDPKPDDRLVDAYAGVGTLGLTMAFAVQEVRGMEIIPEAVADAKRNAAQNDIHNAQYEVGAAETVFPKWARAGFQPTALVVDPPRPGLDPAFKKALVKARPEKFVYISCNPSTLARDLRDLQDSYRVDWIQPIDMFPQTPRWEGVVKLSRK
ncbi:23S rRNA (uracil(1939)-C(5))-methyltransferase RlmD [Leuconostocaceae bacterium ESL0958]|nr:23S rRNA (uracil(1939)-C(5))-methyltransferase RlmD [Leuconostocaceae bacterium ESL0958]